MDMATGHIDIHDCFQYVDFLLNVTPGGIRGSNLARGFNLPTPGLDIFTYTGCRTAAIGAPVISAQ